MIVKHDSLFRDAKSFQSMTDGYAIMYMRIFDPAVGIRKYTMRPVKKHILYIFLTRRPERKVLFI